MYVYLEGMPGLAGMTTHFLSKIRNGSDPGLALAGWVITYSEFGECEAECGAESSIPPQRNLASITFFDKVWRYLSSYIMKILYISHEMNDKISD